MILDNRKKRFRTVLPFLAILLIFLLFKLLQPERFGTFHSINILLQQTLMQSIIGCGLYFLNEMGIFDMTLGANMIISAMIGCKLSEVIGIPGLIFGGILTGILIAFIGSLFMTRLKMNPMIISVGLIIIYEAISTMLTQGAYALQIDPRYRVIGQAPGNVIISILVLGISGIMAKYTKFGLYINAIGSNQNIASSMGINVLKFKSYAFIYAGVCAGVMGIVNLCYSNSMGAASGLSSASAIFTPLMACMFAGAYKKYLNPIIALVLGNLFMSLIANGLLTNGLESSLQNVSIGIMLLILVHSSGNSRKYDVSK